MQVMIYNIGLRNASFIQPYSVIEYISIQIIHLYVHIVAK